MFGGKKNVFFTKQKWCNCIPFGVKQGKQLISQVNSSLINAGLCMVYAKPALPL